MSETRGCLIDTPVLVRLVNTSDVLHVIAFDAVSALHASGEVLCIVPQNLIEFRSIATRPVLSNGLGYAIEQAEEKADELEALFQLIDDQPSIYPAWKALVHIARTTGKQVHDARLAASCQSYGIERLLTFNQRHFIMAPRFWTMKLVDLS